MMFIVSVKPNYINKQNKEIKVKKNIKYSSIILRKLKLRPKTCFFTYKQNVYTMETS